MRERDVVLDPLPRPRRAVERTTAGRSRSRGAALRVVGPGRRERAYQQELVEARREREAARSEARVLAERASARERELALAERVERGSQRRLDRLEDALATAEQREKRLALTLGALQRETELLRARLAGAPALAANLVPALVPNRRALPAGRSPGSAPRTEPRRGWLARLLGRAGRERATRTRGDA